MPQHLDLGGIAVDVERKAIKNIHLTVHPPTGRVRIAAPTHLDLETIRIFAITKLGWIKRQQRQLQAQDRDAPREYLERESHHVWGKRYLLSIVEADQAPSVELKHSRMVLTVRPGTTESRRQEIVEEWYRDQLRQAVPPLLAKWEPLVGVKVKRLFVQHMKTKWGGCSPKTGSIRLNTDLAQKPLECLEYILVHEMVHLLEPTHSERFVALMDRFLLKWRELRKVLNDLPVRHEEWGY